MVEYEKEDTDDDDAPPRLMIVEPENRATAAVQSRPLGWHPDAANAHVSPIRQQQEDR